MDNLLKTLFGTIPNDKGIKRRLRIHQGWWRMSVLIEKAGKHPIDIEGNVCNTIYNGIINKKNFLTENSIAAVERTLKDRRDEDAGLMEQERLFNNLLSSQPLCFNFFGELMIDCKFGLQVLQIWFPEITELKRAIFEFAPKERFTKDNSAFDIAFEVMKNDQLGLIGLECKYTDTFSSTEYDKPAYEEIYSKSNAFLSEYKVLKNGRYNQLFRNQLIAEALIQNKKYDFVKTGLFCYNDDESAIDTANEFKKKLVNSQNFRIITYSNYIEKIQQLNLNWKQREWTMLLWARYCALVLSNYLSIEVEE